MKPEFEKIDYGSKSSFNSVKIIRNNRPVLTQAWHFHPQIEICYTLKSSGTRYVGNNISQYSEGDLVLLGSNLPHGFTTSNMTEQYVIQFDYDFLGKGFMSTIEMEGIKSILQLAKRGIVLNGELKEDIQAKVKHLFLYDNMKKLIILLDILDSIALSDQWTTICSEQYTSSIRIGQLSRIKKLFTYIEENFHHDITVHSASQLLNLTEAGFYKFIQKHTKKKFTTILNDYRISHASKLLINDNLTIAQICYQCGYNNLSYFNRKFKEIMGKTPKEFRSKYNVKQNTKSNID